MIKLCFTFQSLVCIAFILRLALLIYGEWQDANLTVKYTDIDYIVFTDAARFVTKGQSPYQRATYRYTPLLAIILTPNIFLFQSFGKCLFALADLVVGYLIHRILLLRGMSSNRALWLDALWLLNPMVANISTRGSAEALLCAMVIGTLYLIVTRQFYPACVLFGLSVHFKIYPVIYAIPLLLLLDERYGTPFDISQVIYSYQYPRLFLTWIFRYPRQRPNRSDRNTSSSEGDTSARKLVDVLQNQAQYLLRESLAFLTPTRLIFGLLSGGTFFALMWGMYELYGDEFLQHTYFYHVTRQDHRHNFSVWFYHMYLSMDEGAFGKILGLSTFLPQLFLVTVVGIAFGKDIFFACFLQTFVFVTFNKVCTSQYFMWYMCLLPLVLPSTTIRVKTKGPCLIAAWVAGQAIWLQYAYQLEFLGQNTFLKLWQAGILFFVINCWITVELIKHHQYENMYGASGRIRWVWGFGDPPSAKASRARDRVTATTNVDH